MSYSTLEDLQKKISNDQLIELTDDVSADAIDQAKIDAAILEADELIDSYIGKVKAVPLSPVPGLIKNLSVNIAIWNLFVSRSVVDEVREGAYKEALKSLREIARRERTLGDDEAALPEQTTEGGPVSSRLEEDREFNNDSLTNF